MRVSPSYCSPELARAVLSKQTDRMRASCALDMWSFGLIVFELFCRQGAPSAAVGHRVCSAQRAQPTQSASTPARAH